MCCPLGLQSRTPGLSESHPETSILTCSSFHRKVPLEGAPVPHLAALRLGTHCCSPVGSCLERPSIGSSFTSSLAQAFSGSRALRGCPLPRDDGQTPPQSVILLPFPLNLLLHVTHLHSCHMHSEGRGRCLRNIDFLPMHSTEAAGWIERAVGQWLREVGWRGGAGHSPGL